MAGSALDADRLAQLRVFSQAELHAIAESAASVITDQLRRLERALAKTDLTTVADAAHRARNETLLVGANKLTDAFAVLEAAARDGNTTGARAAARQVNAVWPETHAAIDGIARGD
jgi:HPt (histidine-containing phosphotransfer) domain-containing protein